MSRSLPPVMFFEPDGYVLDGPKLMGRQSAGNGFLRAVIAASQERVLTGGSAHLDAWTPHLQSAQIFARIVNEQAPELVPRWVPSDRLDLLEQNGALFLPGPGLAGAARQRLRANPGEWSLIGTTHTLCSHTAMDAVVGILSEPVMPWDALICSSTVAQHVVKALFELQAQYLAWRFDVKRFVTPQLPVIPFGVHQSDFEFSAHDRLIARKKLSLPPEKITILFAGRLSFHAKAHPYPMFVALQRAAERANQDVELLLCGQFPNDSIRQAFFEGIDRYAPNVHAQWVDGKNFSDYNEAWAASDLFASMSDNLQETFGITPVEAMATGLPVVVTDWDGYKDTVIDGVTGYRVPTWMPPPNVGTALAAAFEAGTINFDRYIGLACLEVSVNLDILASRFYALITQPELRAKMGAAGKHHVGTKYDWAVVMRQHMVLWDELRTIRLDGVKKNVSQLASAPRAAPARQDPYRVFSSFPTHVIHPETLVKLEDEYLSTSWEELRNDMLFSFAGDFLPRPDAVKNIISCFAQFNGREMSVRMLSETLAVSSEQIIRLLAPMAKLGFVSFVAPGDIIKV